MALEECFGRSGMGDFASSFHCARGDGNTLQCCAKSPKNIPQGLKPSVNYQAFAARLKSCPCYKTCSLRVFPQPVKPSVYYQAFAARLKSCPCYKTDTLSSFFAASGIVPFQRQR